MRRVISLLAAVVASGIAGEAAAIPNCDQIDTGWCLGGDNCDHKEVQFQACLDGTKLWRCHWWGGCQEDWSSWSPCCCAGCGPYQCDCLLEGTPITLADGSAKPVEAVRQGDRVLSYDETSVLRAASQPSEVVAVFTPYLAGSYFIINETIRVTGTHPILSKGKWVVVSDLRVGDVLTAADGSDLPIISLQKVNKTARVYNFQVALGTYVAHGIIVHNKEDCPRAEYNGPE